MMHHMVWLCLATKLGFDCHLTDKPYLLADQLHTPEVLVGIRHCDSPSYSALLGSDPHSFPDQCYVDQFGSQL